VPAGYSGTPLAGKLGIKAGYRLGLIGAPLGWSVEGLPEDVRVSRRATARGADVVVGFFDDLATLRRRTPRLAQAIVANGSLWLAWPRRAGGHHSDITDNEIRSVVLPLGLVDVKVAALDEDWSGLKMVWRKELRPNL
jgi:hypothetical protein